MKLNLTKPLAVLDLETTGIRIATDRIIEISIIKIMPDGKEITLTHLINPTIPIPAETTAIHGIKDEDVKDKPTFTQLGKELYQFLQDCDLGGYNSNRFDVPLLIEEFLRADINFELKNRYLVDVQNIFHKMEPRTLKAAYKFYCGKELVDAHKAEADTKATYEILKSQLDMYKDVEYTDKDDNTSKPIINNIKALYEFSHQSHFVDMVGHIVYNDKGVEVFNFGKHKGKAVQDIFKSEPQYYDWMMKAEFPLYTKKIITALKLRDFAQGSINFG